MREKRAASNSRPYDGGSTDKWAPNGKQANKCGNANVDTNTNMEMQINVDTITNMEMLHNYWGYKYKHGNANGDTNTQILKISI